MDAQERWIFGPDFQMKRVVTFIANKFVASKAGFVCSPAKASDVEAWPLVVMFHNSYPLIQRGDVFHTWNATTAQIKSIVEYISQRYEFIDEAYLLANLGSFHKFKGKALLTFDDGLACTRFRRHRVRCFYGTGGKSWKDEGSHASSSLRLCG